MWPTPDFRINLKDKILEYKIIKKIKEGEITNDSITDIISKTKNYDNRIGSKFIYFSHFSISIMNFQESQGKLRRN